MTNLPTPKSKPIRKQKPRPVAKPYVLCIGKWISIELTAEKYGFPLSEKPERKGDAK
jgi:hypothetical protein